MLGGVGAVEERLHLEVLTGHQLDRLHLALEVGVEQDDAGFAGLEGGQLEVALAVGEGLVVGAGDRDGDLGDRLPVGAVADRAGEGGGGRRLVGSLHLGDAEDEAIVDGDGRLDAVDLGWGEQELPGGLDGGGVQLGMEAFDEIDLGGDAVLVDDDADEHVASDALGLEVVGVVGEDLGDQLGGAGEDGGFPLLGQGGEGEAEQQGDQQPGPHGGHHSGRTGPGGSEGVPLFPQVHDRVAVSLLDQEELALRREVLLAGVAGDEGDELRRPFLRAEDPAQALRLLLA